MYSLTHAEVDEARAALVTHGITGFFPPLPEWALVQANWEETRAVIVVLDLDTYTPLDPISTYALKKPEQVRPITLLHVQDVIVYTALVLILRDSIEAQRLPKALQKSFSYRASGPGTLYRSRGAFEQYRQRTTQRLALTKTRFVATIDITDFFPRIYQHRLENALDAATTDGRQRDTVRVLMKFLNRLSGGRSYGIPTGPYASRNLGEAVLIDVDSALQAKGVDFVRWLDDFTVFTRTEHAARELIQYIAAWLHDKHGLSLNSSKTAIFPRARFLTDVWKTYDDDRDEFRRLVRELNEAVDYDDDDEVDNQEDDDVVDAANLPRIFNLSLTIEDRPKYGLVRFLLERALLQPGVPEAIQREVLRQAMDTVWDLLPVFDAIARALVETRAVPDAQLSQFARRVLRELRQRAIFQPGQVLVWLCWLVGEAGLRGVAREVRELAESTVDECVRREALIAVSKIGTRADVLDVKDRYRVLPQTVRPGLVIATRLLGADERRFWRRELAITDYYDKLIFTAPA